MLLFKSKRGVRMNFLYGEGKEITNNQVGLYWTTTLWINNKESHMNAHIKSVIQ